MSLTTRTGAWRELDDERRLSKFARPNTRRVKLPSTACRARQVLRLRREANVGRTHNAGLRHRGLQVVSAKPSSGFRHVGDILKDEDIIRVFGASEYSAIRDACRIAGLLMV